MRPAAIALILLVSACAGSGSGARKDPPPKTAAASPTRIAVVNGVTLTQAELEAVEEKPDSDPAARARFELALARKLALQLPPGRTSLVVDHAWVKDAPKAKVQAANRKVLEKLRTAAMAGTHIPDAWKQLGVPGELWHIGDHEEYAYEVLPLEARDTPAGKVSPIAAGDGGLHLFEVHERKELPPSAEEVREILRASLREDAK